MLLFRQNRNIVTVQSLGASSQRAEAGKFIPVVNFESHVCSVFGKKDKYSFNTTKQKFDIQYKQAKVLNFEALTFSVSDFWSKLA